MKVSRFLFVSAAVLALSLASHNPSWANVRAEMVNPHFPVAAAMVSGNSVGSGWLVLAANGPNSNGHGNNVKGCGNAGNQKKPGCPPKKCPPGHGNGHDCRKVKSHD